MAPQELTEKTATELGPLLKSRKISPVELTDACLAQIAAHDKQINAFLTVTAERARAHAKQAEADIAKGRYKGPLHGIPYAVKDIIATNGIRTTNGSRSTANNVPTADAAVVTRLEQSGAILLGKLNLLEFAMGSGQRGLNGPARNPWSIIHSPSGSSSGSGAALAARMTPLTLGTDTGGSIRGPAKSCGVAGMKPTYGLVPVDGVTTLSWSLDHVGPMARSVADVAKLIEAITGQPFPHKPNIKGLRIGVPKDYFFTNVHPETDAALRQVMTQLTQLGATLTEFSIPNAKMCGAVSAIILGSESATYHQKRLQTQADQLDPLVRERLEANSCYSAVDYIQALRLKTILTAETDAVFQTCDAILLPAGNAAPLLADEIVTTDIPPVPPPPARPDVVNLANITGMPSLVIPCGFTTTKPTLPLGVQFCAPRGADARLLQIGEAYQNATNYHRPSPMRS
jgi:aspartyl-tRNA(Asn)/glutamyl-tRNA(Gln) amidotransferase subunit A